MKVHFNSSFCWVESNHEPANCKKSFEVYFLDSADHIANFSGIDELPSSGVIPVIAYGHCQYLQSAISGQMQVIRANSSYDHPSG